MNREPLDRMSRRQAMARVSALFGGASLVGHAGLLEALARVGSEPDGWTATEVALLDEVAETILPETKTPGAKAAGVGPFVALMVKDAYDPDEQKVFREGLRTIDRECTEIYGHPFLSATPSERVALLERIDREQYDHMQTHDEPVHYFRMMKELSLLGYFTSEVGYNEAQRYVETPGRYEPCVPYRPGDKAWANHA